MFCSSATNRIQNVQDYSCIILLLAVEMLNIYGVWEDLLPRSHYEDLGLTFKVTESLVCKVSFQFVFGCVTLWELFCRHFASLCTVFNEVSSCWLTVCPRNEILYLTSMRWASPSWQHFVATSIFYSYFRVQPFAVFSCTEYAHFLKWLPPVFLADETLLHTERRSSWTCEMNRLMQ